MPDLRTVAESLVFGKPTNRSSGGRHVYRLEEGIYHVAFDDGDVYVVTVRHVPRVHVPLHRPVHIGQIDGVAVELVRISYTDHLEIILDAEPGPTRDAGLAAFRAARQRWEQHPDRRPPPPWPGDRAADITVTVVDDVDTSYRFACGETGGMDTEYRRIAAFLPAPPPQARALTLTFTAPGTTPLTTHIPLPPPPNRSTTGPSPTDDTH